MDDTRKLWGLRHYIGEQIALKSPEYERSIKEIKKINVNIKRLPEIGYSKVSPETETIIPECDSFRLGTE